MTKLLISTAALGLMAAVVTTPALALGPKASGGGSWSATPQTRYQVPADYGANMAMHPYTAGHGLCVNGMAHGCNVAPSHYNQK